MGDHDADAQPRLVTVWFVSLELTVNILLFFLGRMTVAYVGVGNGDQKQDHQCNEDAATDKQGPGVPTDASGRGFRGQNQRVQVILQSYPRYRLSRRPKPTVQRPEK